jgi:hypothetical protein
LRPTAAQATASCAAVTLRKRVRSMRPNRLSLMPAELAADRMLTPAPRRLSRISAPVIRAIRSDCSRPRSTLRSRVATKRACRDCLIANSSGFRPSAALDGRASRNRARGDRRRGWASARRLVRARGDRRRGCGAPSFGRRSAVGRSQVPGVGREPEPHFAREHPAMAEMGNRLEARWLAGQQPRQEQVGGGRL